MSAPPQVHLRMGRDATAAARLPGLPVACILAPIAMANLAPTRRHVRRALKAEPWAEPLMLAFAPVFALLAVVTAKDAPGMVWVWWVFASLSSVCPVASFVEQRRRVSLVRELCARREELSTTGLARDGALLRADTELRSYPIHISFLLIVSFSTATCPSPRPRNLARGLALAINLFFGWWSLGGLFLTPVNLWRCVRGGDMTTPGALVALVDAEPAPDLGRELGHAARVAGVAAGVLAVIVAVCAVVVHFALK